MQLEGFSKQSLVDSASLVQSVCGKSLLSQAISMVHIGTAEGWLQAQEPRSRQRVPQCAAKHRYALAGCLAVVAVYLLWMASSSLSGKRGEPGWVHRRERGSGSIGTFKLRCMPTQFHDLYEMSAHLTE